MLLSETSQGIKVIYYMILSIWHSGKGKIRVSKKIRDFQGLKQRKGWVGEAQGIIYCGGDPVMVNLYMIFCIYPNPQNYTTQRANPNVNNGL